MTLAAYRKNLKQKLKPRTVVFLVKDGKVLLGYKKRGFGKGYFIGIGGKVENGERIEDAATREIDEEIKVKISVNTLQKVAILKFYFPHIADESWNQEVHAYLTKEWQGEPTTTDEIKPTWFNINELPLDKMWDDAHYWIPNVLNGSKIYDEYLFDEDLKVVDTQRFKKIEQND